MKKILIIDDDSYISDMLAELLTREGYQPLRAYSGTEALLLLEQNRDRPGLMLLDLMLPGLNGEELLPRLSGIPVIVVSAKVDISDKVNLLLSGAADYITESMRLPRSFPISWSRIPIPSYPFPPVTAMCARLQNS